MKKIKIGTRGSKLALAQAKIVEELLKNSFPDVGVEIVVIKTQGDKILDKPLTEIGDKGLFVNEFESALLSGEIDIAVHSAKDLPSDLRSGLEVVCTPPRADERDMLVVRKNSEKVLVVGTSSPRREFYIKKYFPEAEVKMIRGNIDTRLSKLANGEYDAIVLAKAGLDRLGIEFDNNDIFEFRAFDADKFVPAACQGIIAVEARNDFEFKHEMSKINDDRTYRQYKIEREALKYLQVSCSEINGVYSKFLDDNTIEILLMYRSKEIRTLGEYSKVFVEIPQLVAQIKS